MKANFKAALDFVMAHECVFAPGNFGDYTQVMAEDVPGDAGGLTKFGIDQADHPNINIKALDYAGATQIYHDGEWTKCQCDELPAGVDVAVFDTAVNCGTGTAAKMLQQALNDEGASLTVDGFIGAKTIAAAEKNSNVVYHFLALRDAHYRDIVIANASNAQFTHGWLSRIADLELVLGKFSLTNGATA